MLLKYIFIKLKYMQDIKLSTGHTIALCTQTTHTVQNISNKTCLLAVTNTKVELQIHEGLHSNVC